MRGVVWDGAELGVVDDLEVTEPGSGEVAVQVVAAGLCSSDVSVVTGRVPYPPPVVLGHEATGVIDAVGPGVDGLGIGDTVVLTALASCGQCAQCRRGRPTLCRGSAATVRAPFRRGGQPVNQFSSVGAFAERTVVQARQVVPIDGIRPEVAAVLGCAVLTGVGAALNRAPVPLGGSVLVCGAGGIGLNAVQGARLAGAATVVVCEAQPRKEAIARAAGATHFEVTTGGHEVAGAVKRIIPDGVDVAYECTGHPDLLQAAVRSLAWGGTAVVVGLPPVGVDVCLTPRDLYHDKALVGCRLGSGDPDRDLPALARLYRAGELLLDELVSDVVPLDEAPRLIDRLRAGEIDRGVVKVAK